MQVFEGFLFQVFQAFSGYFFQVFSFVQDFSSCVCFFFFNCRVFVRFFNQVASGSLEVFFQVVFRFFLAVFQDVC